MDDLQALRARVGHSPLVVSKRLRRSTKLTNLYLKVEGTNPTGTQKDRIAVLEVQEAVRRGSKKLTVASCGNYGAAISVACYHGGVECIVMVPEDFGGKRVELMEAYNAKVQRVPGTYEDAVDASRKYAEETGAWDANPGRNNTPRALAGYAAIAMEILKRMKEEPPKAVGVPVGNGSTLAGVHSGFRTAWAAGDIAEVPIIAGGTSQGNHPMVDLDSSDAYKPMKKGDISETHINEPLVNWHALDGQEAQAAVADSGGEAYGVDDHELLSLHEDLLEDGWDAHPASLAAVAALEQAAKAGHIQWDDPVVAVLTSGQPLVELVEVDTISRQEILQMLSWLGPWGDPYEEIEEAIQGAIKGGYLVQAKRDDEVLGWLVLTPMELSKFFPKYHLSYVAVSPNARGQGVGTRLLEDALERSNGDLSLHVDIANEGARRLYARFGFTSKYVRMLYPGRSRNRGNSRYGAGWAEEEPLQATVA